ncbi:MAG: ComEC/Rec2 family competence protein [Flavobacteriales bacterium]
MEEERLRGPWEEVRKAPLLRVGVGFVLGILLGRSMPLDAVMALLLWLFVTVMVVVGLLPQRVRWAHRLRLWRYRIPLLMSWAVLSGVARQSMADPHADPWHFVRDDDREAVWLLEVRHLNGASERVLRSDAVMLARDMGGSWAPRTGTVMLTLMRQDTGAVLRAGDVVVVDGIVEDIVRNADPGGFDRAGWAASKGIHHELFVAPEGWHLVGHRHRWTDLFTTARGKVSAWLQVSGLQPAERALVKALVLGQRDELDPSIGQAFVRSGTVHVLAVSGMHVGLIYVLLGRLLSVLGQGRHAGIVRALLLLLCLWAYAGLTGGSPSVLRATTMFSFFVLAEVLGRRQSSLNSLTAAAVLLLAWDPGMLVQASFQLSFLAVLGILLFLRPLRALWHPRAWLLQQVWSLVAVSVAAQVFTTPVSLLLFKAFPLWFLPANVVVVTAMSFAIYVSLAFVVFHWVPYLSALLVLVLSWTLRAATVSAAFIADLPAAYPAVRINILTALLLYALILALAVWLVWRWRSARTATVMLTAVAMLSWVLAARQAQEGTALVVYDDRTRFLLGLVQGRSIVAFGPEEGAEVLRDKVERHARHAGIGSVTHVALDSLHAAQVQCRGAWCWAAGAIAGPAGGVRLFSGRLTDEVKAGLPASVLIFHDLVRLDTNALRPLTQEAEQVVLAGTLRWRHRTELRAWAAAHGLALHEVRNDGSFIR